MKTKDSEAATVIAAPTETPVIRKADVESTPLPMHIANIVVPLDFSEMSLKALRYAVPFARQFQAKLTLVHVVELPGYTPELPYPAALPPDKTEEVVKELKEVAKANVPPEVPVEVVARHDFAPDAVVEVARELKADLIITATHGRTGLKHVFLGSTAEKIVRLAPCPVLVVRECERDFV